VSRTLLLAALVGCAHRPPPRTALDDQPPRLVSAFFGLDHAMPEGARALCWRAPGQDGLPVTFSRRVVGAIDPASFTVRLRSGALRHPACATTAPADGPGKGHTVLLIGELGGEPADPPVAVEITGALGLSGDADARGLTGPVIPLAAGPTMVLALGAVTGTLDSDCPAATRQLVVVIWSGGVHPAAGADQAAHLAGYEVETVSGVVRPFALGDLGDRDNYVHLCLTTDAPARLVRFPAGVLADPRGDLNPASVVEVSPPSPAVGARR
jgi:hypothetical protein